MKRQPMGPILGPWFKGLDEAPPDAQESAREVMARVPQTRQRGRWWPLPALDRKVSTFPTREPAPAPIPATNGRQPARGYTMFSALKFVAAGVIVALFGGFLLAGLFTAPQGDEMAPAAVTESPAPEATSEATDSTDPSIRADILPGVALTVEEVEADVYRIVDDGVRDVTYHPEQSDMGWRSPQIIAGDDGGIWVLQGDVYYRLGMIHGHEEEDWYPNRVMPDGVVRVADFEVAPGGTVWAAVETVAAPAQAPEDALYLWSSDDEDGVLHMPTGPFDAPVEVTPDGTVWAVWLADPEAGAYGSRVFGYLGADGWIAVGEWPDGDLSVSDGGEVWVPGRTAGWFDTQPRRFAEGTWHQIGDHPVDALAADIGPEGTLWGIGFEGSVRFDGAEWMVFESPDWLPTDHGGWMLVEDEWVFVSLWDYEAALEEAENADPATTFRASFPAIPWGEPHVAPDGSLWVPARLGVWGDRDQPVCDHGIDGVARHDGTTWSRFLQGRCVEAMDIAADGSVWLLVTESGARFPLIETYVITPEAVAAKEQ